MVLEHTYVHTAQYILQLTWEVPWVHIYTLIELHIFPGLHICMPFQGMYIRMYVRTVHSACTYIHGSLGYNEL